MWFKQKHSVTNQLRHRQLFSPYVASAFFIALTYLLPLGFTNQPELLVKINWGIEVNWEYPSVEIPLCSSRVEMINILKTNFVCGVSTRVDWGIGANHSYSKKNCPFDRRNPHFDLLNAALPSSLILCSSNIRQLTTISSVMHINTLALYAFIRPADFAFWLGRLVECLFNIIKPDENI
jgi:hypothetical protein